MQPTNRVRFFTVGILSLSLSHLPQVVFAETVQANKMISTTEVLERFDRKMTEEKLTSFLSQQDIQQKLVDQGVSVSEAKARIASLSDSELQNLSQQIDKAQYGGDILITVLLIVLIIYLVKRL
ncbi:MAG: PA2779 family protein [Bdellovibrionota bacterium]